MNRFGLSLIVSILCCLTITENIYAANRVVYENFDDRSLTDTRIGTTSDWYKNGSYSFAKGRSGSGYAISWDLSQDRDSTLLYYPKSWSTDEMYVSIWMRYPDAKTTKAGDENMKFFYPHFRKGGYVGYALMNIDTGTVYYSAKDNNGSMLTTGKWTSIPGVCDGNWHHYEWYIKFSTGVHKFWYDGTLKINYTYGSGKWDNDIYYIAAPSIDAKEESYFSRQIDDYEIWDGMPSSTSTSNISSNNNNAPPPPGKPYVVK